MKSFKIFISIVFAFQGILASLDCKKWRENHNSQLLMNPYRLDWDNCSQYIEDCGSYDACISDRPSDKNGCECFYNQKKPSNSFSWFYANREQN